MRLVLLLGFGGLPLWLAILFVFYSYSTMSGEYAGMALWALVPALPATLATTAIAMATVGIYSGVNGSKKRKACVASSFFALASIALLIVVAKPFWEKRQAEKEIEHERPQVEQFVTQNAHINAQVGAPKAVSIVSYTTLRDDLMPSTYDVGVEGSEQIYAIIKVNRTKERTTFSLECTTKLYMGHRDARKGPCEQ